MARTRARVGLVLGGVLAAAGGVAVNRVGGSDLQQAGLFAVAAVIFIAAGAVTRWGDHSPGFRLRTTDAQGGPRQLGDVELGELGVHWSQTTADGYGPYVERNADSGLDEAISSGQTLVAVSGAVLAGRTRTLAEAARRYLADSWLAWFDVLPDTSLSELVAEARRIARGGPVVLWLENATLALLSQFSAQLLDELPPGFRILMSLNEDLLNGHILPGTAAEVLNAPGACVHLGMLTNEERERLTAEPAYAAIAAAHEDEPVLMGRLMVSLDMTIDAIQVRDEESVSRVAILHATVDWQRAAVPEPLTRQVIEELYRGGYWQQMANRAPGTAASRNRFRQAIKQLLVPAPGHSLRLLDEIYSGRETHLRPHSLLPVVADSPQQPPGWMISEHLWDYLATALDDQQRLNVGLNAAGRKDYEHARRLLDSLDVARIPAQITFEIAAHAATTNQDAAARDWYQKALARGDPDITSRAMAGLGGLDLRQGRVDEARTWLRKAAAAGHQDASAEAMFNLGVLESRQGYTDEARSWYRKAIASRNTTFAPVAMLNLGLLESRQGLHQGCACLVHQGRCQRSRRSSGGDARPRPPRERPWPNKAGSYLVRPGDRQQAFARSPVGDGRPSQHGRTARADR